MNWSVRSEHGKSGCMERKTGRYRVPVWAAQRSRRRGESKEEEEEWTGPEQLVQPLHLWRRGERTVLTPVLALLTAFRSPQSRSMQRREPK